MSEYIPTIGLEVHAQLNTASKMFCSCPSSPGGYGAAPNTQTCPVCLGMPGALPVLNGGAIELTILTGLMLGCEINEHSKWDRKNYFYPDMPKNYQISQFDLPLCLDGSVPLYHFAYPKDAQNSIEAPGKFVQLERIHLEEDVAKSTHHEKHSSIDFNRAGTPLMEIVSKPDIDSAEEAFAYLNSLRQILVYGGVSDADMEKGQMRCDVNISVRPPEQKELGEKIELKNLNSPGAVRRAIHFEVERQVEVLNSGGSLKQSTRRWDDDLGETTEMREKEDAHDYRYFPDPDLLPVETAEMKARVLDKLPELPHQKEERFVSQYGITEYDASVLASDKALAEWFEEAAKGASAPKKIANWVINNLLGMLNERDLKITDSPINPQQLAQLVEMVEAGSLAGNQAKQVAESLFETPDSSIEKIIAEKGFEPADNSEIEEFVKQVISENPAVVADIAGGNPKASGFLVGQVMKLSGGKANPKNVNQLLLESISS